MAFPKIIGILNVTPDSFSDGGKYMDREAALSHAQRLFEEGADMIDVGAESTRPGSVSMTWEQEWERLKDILPELLLRYPGKVSLDTRHGLLAEKYCALGGGIVNGVDGFQDPRLVEVAGHYDCLCILNHFPGKTAKGVHEQKISSINQVVDELLERKAFLVREGILPEDIVLDPGIGFGKTMELNEELLAFARYVPTEQVLIGHSRKRFLGEGRFTEISNVKAAQRAIDSGADYLRVHDPAWYRKP